MLKKDIEQIQGNESYKAGDSVTVAMRSVGRSTSAKNKLYTYIIFDKSIEATDAEFTFASGGNIVPLGHSNATGGIDDSLPVEVISIENNVLTLTIPIVNTLDSANIPYYLEETVTVTFE